MKQSYIRVIICGLFLLATKLYAQDVNIIASIDSTTMPIGEQTKIHLEVTQGNDRQIEFPVIPANIVDGIEVLYASPVDTIKHSDHRFTLKQDILVTSFDTALYYIPPFKFVAGQDTLLSNPLALKVLTFDIPEDEEGIFDIKGIKSAPFVLSDYYSIILLVLVLIVAILLGVYFYKRWKFRKDHPELIGEAEIKLPAHEVALEALSHLKDQKLWEKGMNKEYYTELTNVVREYLVDRFGINAMEMTSGEILDALRKADAPKEIVGYMKQIGEVADFVKFAKMVPLADDNELSMLNATRIVKETIKVEEPVVEPVSHDTSDIVKNVKLK